MVLSGVHSFKNQRKKQKRGFPIKDFGNDGRGRFPIKDFGKDGGKECHS